MRARSHRRTRLAAVALSAAAGGLLGYAATGSFSSPAEARDVRQPDQASMTELRIAAQIAPEEPITPPDRIRNQPVPRNLVSVTPPSPPPLPGTKVPSYYDPMGTRFARGRVITGATSHRLILFTFDDGPDPRYTPRLLDILDQFGIKAVFFMRAGQIAPDTPLGRRRAELAREVARRGHTIGSHTIDHTLLPLLDNAGVLSQLTGSEQIFERVFGARPWLVRPPSGARSDRTDALVESRGYTQVLWNLGADDFGAHTPQQVLQTFETVLDRRAREDGERGGIIVLHDTHPWSVDAVPLIVNELRRRNCELLAQGAELYDIVDDPSLFFAPRRSGDAPGVSAAPANPSPALIAARQARVRAEARSYCRQGRLVASNR